MKTIFFNTLWCVICAFCASVAMVYCLNTILLEVGLETLYSAISCFYFIHAGTKYTITEV